MQLTKRQIEFLRVLEEASGPGGGPITRYDITVRVGGCSDNTWHGLFGSLSAALRQSNRDWMFGKDKPKKISLIEMGYVSVSKLTIEDEKKTVYRITESGKAALKEAEDKLIQEAEEKRKAEEERKRLKEEKRSRKKKKV